MLAERTLWREHHLLGVSDASFFVVMRECSGWEPLAGQPPEADVALRGDRPGEPRVADLVTGLGVPIGQLTRDEVVGEEVRKHPEIRPVGRASEVKLEGSRA